MKKVFFIVSSLLVSTGIFSQTTQVTPTASQNYIHKTVYKKGYQESSLGSVSGDDKIETVSYYDGLGRLIQTVDVRQGGKDNQGNDTDLITPVVYDDLGRQEKDYLALISSSNDGRFDNDAVTNTHNYYKNNYNNEITATDPNPFSKKEFEPSPLNRVSKQAAPGEDWKLGNGNEIEYDYQTNIANKVRLYSVSLSGPTPVLQNLSPYHYTAGRLYKDIVRDENHSSSTKSHSTEEFEDKAGRLILKRAYIDNTPHDTYFVYDDLGNLSFILPPKAEAQAGMPNSTILSELCYQYIYDERNRLIEKKLPGKDWEYIVYDKLDQPILTQDANLKSQGKWMFTKYDVFGRVAFTGISNMTGNRSSLQTLANQTQMQWVSKQNGVNLGGAMVYYTNDTYPDVVSEVLTINYYDNYTFDNDGLLVPSNTVYHRTINGVGVKGLITCSKVKVLGTNKWTTTVTGYDKNKRTIWIGTKNNYFNTTNYVENKMEDTVDWILETKTVHKKIEKADVVSIDKFIYDHSGRVTSHTKKIGKLPEQFIAVNEYDELGQITRKKVGGISNDELQVINYNYNVRGWLTDINDVADLGSDDLFAFRLNYNKQETNYGANALYNGNISETLWKTKNDNKLRSYAYGYDALNRISYANYKATSEEHNFSVFNIGYDKNGNITDLKRNYRDGGNNSQLMDNLVYSTDTGNKLLKVADNSHASHKTNGFKDGINSSNDFAYDNNGNLTQDLNKSIDPNGISYNHLNLPTQINFSFVNNPMQDGSINYTYDANGVKLSKSTDYIHIADGGTITHYDGDYVYSGGGKTPISLQFISHPEGYIDVGISLLKIYPRPYTFKYVYQFKDHLDNIRLTYTDNNNDGSISLDEIIEEKNYYPFGLQHKGYNNHISSLGNSIAQEYKTYQSQEFTEDLDYDMFEYKFRHYDPAVGRFFVIDPLAEDYVYNSSYAFQENKLGLGQELEGSELEVFSWLVRNAAKNPDGASRQVLQTTESVVNYASQYLSRQAENLDALGNQMNADLNEFASHGPSWELFQRYNPMSEFGMKELSPEELNRAPTDFTNPNEVADASFPIFVIFMTKGKSGKKTTIKTSRAARREVMRKEGIPTSQKPISQSKNASGREYRYEVYKPGGGKKIKSVQQQTLDRSHRGQNHWEAGSVKVDRMGNPIINKYGTPRLQNGKSKVNYGGGN